MRVERISAPKVNYLKSNSNYKHSQAVRFDSVSFGEKEDEVIKPSFGERIAAFFSKIRPLNPEKELDKEIRTIISLANKQAKRLRKDAKYYHDYLILLYQTGAIDNFNMILMKDNKRVLFGERSPESNLPVSATVVNMSDGVKVDKMFEVPEGLNSPFILKYNFDENTRIAFQILGTTPISFTEYCTDTEERKVLVPTKNGFYFAVYANSDNKESEELTMEINYDPTNWDDTFYMSKNDKGENEVYKYNPERKMWVLD